MASNSGDDDPLFADETALVEHIGAIDDWIENEVEHASFIVLEEDEMTLYATVGEPRTGSLPTQTIHLPYPFRLSDLVTRCRVLDQACDAVFEDILSATDDETTLGVPDAEGDQTAALATYLGDVDVEGLTDALGGEWQVWDNLGDTRYDGEYLSDSAQVWFIPSDDRMVAIGLGVSKVWVTPLSENDEDYLLANDWPDPAFDRGWPDTPDAAAWPAAGERVDALRAAIAQALSPKDVGRRRPGAGDHDVRLSTQNLLVRGIDLDFEVKRGGHRLGTLSVSEGGLKWRPLGQRRKKGQAKGGVPISWKEFADWAES